jgi:hypothetical protein
VQERLVHLPPAAAEAPAAGDRLGSDEHAGGAVLADDAEPNPRVAVRRDDPRRQLRLQPLLFLRVPHPRDLELLVANDDVHVPVGVQVEQADAVVPPVGRAEGLAGEEVGVQSLLHLREREELDLLAVLLHGVVDHLHDLRRLDPPVRVEDEVQHALLDDRDVDQRVPVGDRLRVVRPLHVLGLPVARRGAGELPAQLPDHVRVRVVLDRVHEGFERHVLAELLPAVGVDDQLAREARVLGRGDVEDGRVDREEPLGGRHLVEDLGVEPRARRVQRVAAGHAERDRLRPRHAAEQVDAAVVGGLGLVEVEPGQQRARVVERVRLEAQPLLQPPGQARVGGVELVGHDAERGAPVDLLEPLEDRAAIGLVDRRVAHVVDAEDDNRLHALFADPLRRRQPGEPPADVVRVGAVEVRQAVRVGGGGGRGGGRGRGAGRQRECARDGRTETATRGSHVKISTESVTACRPRPLRPAPDTASARVAATPASPLAVNVLHEATHASQLQVGSTRSGRDRPATADAPRR